MNSQQQQEIATRLMLALDAAGLTIEEGIQRGGNLVCWEPVSPMRLLGRWINMAWRLSVVPPNLEAQKNLHGLTDHVAR